MAFPLATVLTAAPGLISAAADIIRAIKNKKQSAQQSESDKIEIMANLIEKQALVIEELTLNNQNMALAVKNNRILSVVSLTIGIIAIILAL